MEKTKQFKKLELRKLKEGMGFEDCAFALVGGDMLTVEPLMAMMIMAHNLSEGNKPQFSIFRMLDGMEIYESDLTCLLITVCKDNPADFISLIWAAEIGLREDLKIDCCNFEKIKATIRAAQQNRSFSYPFDEARKIIKEYVSITVPETISVM